MKREILNKFLPRIKVIPGSKYPDKTYGKVCINDLSLYDWIGKDVEIEVTIRECYKQS